MFSCLTKWKECINKWLCCCSVAQSHPTLCNPMDCSMPGFPVLHYVAEFAQTHVHWVSDAIQTLSSSVVPFSFCPQSFPASGSFPVSRFFASSGQSIVASASASVLPTTIQGSLPLGLIWFDLVWSPCCPRDSQESPSAPHFESISQYEKAKINGLTNAEECHLIIKKGMFRYTSVSWKRCPYY